MTYVWPRLPYEYALGIFTQVETGALPEAAVRNAAQRYAPVGVRAGEAQVSGLQKSLLEVATSQGFPDRPARDVIEFDRVATKVLHASMPMTWSDASSREVWSFLALVVLPDVTAWRWQTQATPNKERWIGSDLTRHTWGRLWWRAAAFLDGPELLDQLSESDLNQLLERRVIGSDPPLLVALARAVLAADATPQVPRRELIRDTTKRLRRALTYIDSTALGEQQVRSLADRLVRESSEELRASP